MTVCNFFDTYMHVFIESKTAHIY